MANYKNRPESFISARTPEVMAADIYYTIMGYSTGNSTETNISTPLPRAGKFHNVSVKITANANATNCHVFVRAAAASSGTIDVTITGSTTGVFSDLTNQTAIIPALTLVNYFFDYTGSGNISVQGFSSILV